MKESERRTGPRWQAALLPERILYSARRVSASRVSEPRKIHSWDCVVSELTEIRRNIYLYFTQIHFVYFYLLLRKGMPSINMKLEMLTLIACEVDTEVFTSDKMQVRFHNIACFSRASLLVLRQLPDVRFAT